MQHCQLRVGPRWYPIQRFERCVEEAMKLPLREGVLRKYMRENALAVFNWD